MTLKEYLEDYASDDTRRKGERAILEELKHIGSDKVRQITINRLELMKEGKRDFRFNKKKGDILMSLANTLLETDYNWYFWKT